MMNYLVVCIGNREGGDDAVGLYVFDQLSMRTLDNIDLLDVGIALENFTEVIRKKNPDVLLLIDAVDMGLSPGEIRQVPKDMIGVMHVSTHGIPLSVFMKYFEQFIPRVVLIGIQPKKMSGSLSDVLRKSADRLVDIIDSRSYEHILQL